MLVDVATLSTIYDVRHPLLLPPGYPTQELISRPQAVRRLSDILLLPPQVAPREKRKKIRYNLSAFFVTPALPAPSGVVASARLCCPRVPPAVCSSLLESATVYYCVYFLSAISFHVRTYADASFHITIQARSTNTRFTYVQSSTLFRSLNLAFVY